MKIGYARISTELQKTDLQIDALKKAGCEKIYQETISGAKTQRTELDKLLEHLREGDTLVVWKLDRLGRSLIHLVSIMETLRQRNIGFVSLQDQIDMTTPQGRLTFGIFASLAEFERDLIRERTQAGLSAARARGRIGGRPKGLSPDAQKTAWAVKTLYIEKKLSISEICKQVGIARSTLYRYLRHEKINIGTKKNT